MVQQQTQSRRGSKDQKADVQTEVVRPESVERTGLLGTPPQGGETGMFAVLRGTKISRLNPKAALTAVKAAAKTQSAQRQTESASARYTKKVVPARSGGSTSSTASAGSSTGQSKLATGSSSDTRPWRAQGDAAIEIFIAYPSEAGYHLPPGVPEASSCATKVRALIDGSKHEAWDKLAKEFGVQCMIWESIMLGARAVANPGGKVTLGLPPETPEGKLQQELSAVLSAAKRDAEFAVKALQETLKSDQAGKGMLSKSTVESAELAIKGEQMAKRRHSLAGMLEVAASLWTNEYEALNPEHLYVSDGDEDSKKLHTSKATKEASPRRSVAARMGEFLEEALVDCSIEGFMDLVHACDITDGRLCYHLRRVLAWILKQKGQLLIPVPIPWSMFARPGDLNNEGSEGHSSVTPPSSPKVHEEGKEKKGTYAPSTKRHLDLSSLKVKVGSPVIERPSMGESEDGENGRPAQQASPTPSVCAEPPPPTPSPLWATSLLTSSALFTLTPPLPEATQAAVRAKADAAAKIAAKAKAKVKAKAKAKAVAKVAALDDAASASTEDGDSRHSGGSDGWRNNVFIPL